MGPDYWTRHGIPREPEDLRGHDCLIVRNSGGTLVFLDFLVEVFADIEVERSRTR